VEYQARQARITDIDRLYALCAESGALTGTGATLDGPNLLRQLVYMPNASVLVAEAGRQIAGGAVLALRPSIRVGGFVGTVDVLVTGEGHDVGRVADVLIDEVLRSARRKGCTSVEVPVPADATLDACWKRRGFSPAAENIYRAEVVVRAPVIR
jgi:hypothetical protein